MSKPVNKSLCRNYLQKAEEMLDVAEYAAKKSKKGAKSDSLSPLANVRNSPLLPFVLRFEPTYVGSNPTRGMFSDAS